MDVEERKRFIIELIDNVKADILEESVQYPDSWDGVEFRERIKDVFSQVVFKKVMSLKRKRDYNNFVLVNGLL